MGYELNNIAGPNIRFLKLRQQCSISDADRKRFRQSPDKTAVGALIFIHISTAVHVFDGCGASGIKAMEEVNITSKSELH
jgi:hypothetical protein